MNSKMYMYLVSTELSILIDYQVQFPSLEVVTVNVLTIITTIIIKINYSQLRH